MNSTFSIITPTFRQGKFIAKAIESVLSQQGEFYIDYIIMDGGSDDETVSEIKRYEALLKQSCQIQEIGGKQYYVNENTEFKFNQCLGISYHWESKPDKGQSDALNQGLKLASGEVITWLNSDDYFTGGTFAKVQEVLNATNADIVTGNSIALNDAGETIWLQRTGKPSLYAILYCREAPPQPSTFFTRRILDVVGGSVDESLHYTMDTDLWLRMCFAGAKFIKIHDFLSFQVYQLDSKSMEGEKLFAAFEPENKVIRAKYLQRVGLLSKVVYTFRLFAFHYPYVNLVKFGKVIPQPIKDVLNKLIALVTSR